MSDTSIYAIVRDIDGLVVNTSVWDGVTPWTPPDGTTAVLIPEGVVAGPGYTYENGVFTAPPAPPVIPPTEAEILATNTAMRNQLLAAATLAIAPLQDAVDIGEATSADTAMLTAWKTFRVAVNRVVLTVQNPTWPTPPQPGYGAAATPVPSES